MSVGEFSAHEVRHMLLDIRNWLRSGESRSDTWESRRVTMGVYDVHNLGPDKPASHRMLAELFEEGYLDGEYVSSDAGGTYVSHARIRSMIHKGPGEIGYHLLTSRNQPFLCSLPVYGTARGGVRPRAYLESIWKADRPS